MKDIVFIGKAYTDFIEWSKTDRKVFEKISILIEETSRTLKSLRSTLNASSHFCLFTFDFCLKFLLITHHSNLKSQISNLISQISNLKSQISTLYAHHSSLKSQISYLKSNYSMPSFMYEFRLLVK